jgi:hypothetical protein
MLSPIAVAFFFGGLINDLPPVISGLSFTLLPVLTMIVGFLLVHSEAKRADAPYNIRGEISRRDSAGIFTILISNNAVYCISSDANGIAPLCTSIIEGN